jgi:S1-C subfamily serine protease
MSRSATAILILILASAAMAQAPQPQPLIANQAAVPGLVSVVRTIDLQEMVDRMRGQQSLRVGVAGSAPPFIYNITTGLVVDDQGHVVTRLSSLNPQDKNQKLTVTTSEGITLDAKLVGVDFATGFAVLEVASIRPPVLKIAAPSRLLSGATVKILSSDVVPRSSTDRVYLAPSISVSQGHISADTVYSRVHGALTLLSYSLLARSDSSVVVTPENEVVGMVQYAGFGRAYVYPIDSIRDTIAKRVIEKKDNVPAGWLGVTGDNVAQLPAPDFDALGLQLKSGVIVRTVTPDSAAAQAGIMPSDIITGVDDFDIAGAADLKALLSSLPAGRTIKLRAIREHRPVEIKVVLGPCPYDEHIYFFGPFDQSFQSELSEREQLESRLEELKTQYRAYQKNPRTRDISEALRELEIEIRHIYDGLRALGPDIATPSPKPAPEYAGGDFTREASTPDVSFQLGFTARDLNSQLAAILQARGGVLVSNVAKGSAAERAGLKAGDVIVGARRGLMNAAQLRAFLSTRHGAVALKVVRKKEPLVVSLNIQ